MKKGIAINPNEFSDNPLDFLKKHCAILVGNNYKTPLSTDELVTNQYIYLSNKLPFHGAVIVVDKLTDFHLGMTKDFCQKLIEERDYKFKAISNSGNEFNNVSGFAERIVFHRDHGLQHQLLCDNFGDACWVNVTGMEVILQQSLMEKGNAKKNIEPKMENEEFIKNFLSNFEHKVSSESRYVNVKVADYRDAKSHLNSMVRDLSQCVNNKERVSWLTTTERMFFEYRSLSCKRATPDDHRLFNTAINKVLSAMEDCLVRVSKPDTPRQTKAINEQPTESKKILNLNKFKLEDPCP